MVESSEVAVGQEGPVHGSAGARRPRDRDLRRSPPSPVPAFLAADLAALALAVLCCLGVPALAAGVDLSGAGLLRAAAPAGPTVALFALAGLYRRRLQEVEEVRRVVLGTGLLAGADAGLCMLPGFDPAPLWHLLVWPVFAPLALALRLAVRSRSGVGAALSVPVILVGSGEALREGLRRVQGNPVRPVEVLRVAPLSDVAGRDPYDLAALIGREARRAGVAPDAVELVLLPDEAGRTAAQALAARLRRLGQPVSMPGMPVAAPDAGTAERGSRAARIVKRALDLVASLGLLLMLAPFFAIASLVIRRDGGPVFFAQLRVGRNGRRFRCLKFRTMRVDAEERLLDLLRSDHAARAEWETHQKLRRDPRVTPVGRFLRETSLDELPQLLNVLTGEMSLVGPRPIVAPELPGYPGDHAYFHGPHFRAYAACRPGITGLWQVSGRAASAHDERVRLDGWYAANWSLWLDIAILLRTVRAVLQRTGS